MFDRDNIQWYSRPVAEILVRECEHDDLLRIISQNPTVLEIDAVRDRFIYLLQAAGHQKKAPYSPIKSEKGLDLKPEEARKLIAKHIPPKKQGNSQIWLDRHMELCLEYGPHQVRLMVALIDELAGHLSSILEKHFNGYDSREQIEGMNDNEIEELLKDLDPPDPRLVNLPLTTVKTFAFRKQEYVESLFGKKLSIDYKTLERHFTKIIKKHLTSRA